MSDLFGGLPLHPLVVHGVIVLLPLAAIGMIVTTAASRWRGTFQWVILAGVILGAAGSYIAKVSGDSLSAAVGLPVDHANWGNYLVIAASAFSAITGLWIFTWHLHGWTWVKRVVDVLAVLTGVVIMGLTYLAGHSGAESVWKDQMAAARQPPAVAASITGPITLAEVTKHATPDDCWSVVDGTVYDLTGFITRHPAGAGAVIGMCGRDATESFNSEHAGQAEAEGWLDVFRIGTVAP
jgi:uncharacterized membrane protein